MPSGRTPQRGRSWPWRIPLLIVGLASLTFLPTNPVPRVPVVQLELAQSQMCRATNRPDRLDCYFRTGSDSVLHFRISGTSYDDLSAEAVQEGGAADGLSIEPSWWAGATIDLSAYDHRVLSLRLSSKSGRPIAWHAAELRAHTELLPTRVAPLREGGPPRPNILLYVVDTLRASRMSLYGYERDTTPHLKKWAERGLVFDNAYSNGADTRAGIPALLASATPNELRGHMTMVRGRPSTTVAELLKRRSYRTGAFQANITMMKSLGYSRGFDLYKVVQTHRDGQRVKTAAPALHDKALDWLRRGRRFPFFTYVQTMDVHNPYDAPPPFRDRYYRGPTERPLPDVSHLTKEAAEKILAAYATLEPDQYDECVAYADDQINDFLTELEALDLLSETVVIITADHGESLGEGSPFPHGVSLEEEIVRIPLIILLPWAPQHRRLDDIVSLLDLSPTIADLVGLAPPRDWMGRSIFRPRTRHRPPYALGERNVGGQSVEWYLREGPWKVVLSDGPPELFLIPSDPMADHDVSAEYPIMTEYLARRIGAVDRRGGAHRPGKEGLGLSPAQVRDVEEALHALGYE
jgi:arylsulfatase A-like enzyme